MRVVLEMKNDKLPKCSKRIIKITSSHSTLAMQKKMKK